MQITEHFSLEELTESATAVRFGIDNTLPAVLLSHIETLAVGLEQVRALLGYPLHINSGYRSPELNATLGGAKSSAHMQGYAADFICPEFGTPLEICQALQQSHIDFDQCIQEGYWCHISFAPTMRGQVLTAHFGGDGTTYSEGL